MIVLLMDEAAAAALVTATEGSGNRLEPRRIAAGPEAGAWCLPARVRDDAAFAGLADAFAAMTEAVLDPAVAWPPREDEGEI